MTTGTALFNLRRAIWRSIALLVVLVVAYVLLGRQLTPMVERTVPVLEAYLTEALEQPVQITGISGEWRGFGPSFTVRGLTIGDSFSLSSLTLEPAILVSLAKQEAIFSRFLVNGGRISVRHQGGRWGVPAFSAVGQDAELQDFFARLYAQLLAQDAIQLRGIELDIARGAHQVDALLADALIIGTHEYHELRGEVILDPRGQAVSAGLQIEAQNTLSKPHIRAFMRHDTVDTASLLPNLDGLVTSAELDLQQLSLAAQWWLHYEDGELRSVQADVQRGGIAFVTRGSDQLQTLTELSGAVLWEPGVGASNARHQARLRDLSFRYNDQLWPASNHDLSWDELSLNVLTDQVSLSNASAMLQPWLPTDILSRHELRGLVVDSQLTVPRSKQGWQWRDARVSGRVREGEFKAWRTIPGFQRVNGEFSATPREGVFDFSPGPLEVNVSAVLPGPLSLQMQNGAVAWRVSDDHVLQIVSSPLRAHWADSGELDGRFAFTGHLTADSESLAEPVFALALAGNRLNSHSLQAALPTTLDPGIVQWIERNITQLDSRGWSLALPNVMAADAATRIGLMSAQVESLRLEFAPEWPALTQLGGQFWLDHKGLVANAQNGEFSGIRVVSGTAYLPFAADQADLHITAQAGGRGADGWRLVTDTPVRDRLDESLLQWQVNGDVRGDMDLIIPLTGDDIRLDMALEIASGNLWLPEQGLYFDRIEGPLQVSTRKGLTSSGLQAHWFEKPLRVGIRTDVEALGGWRLHFPTEGRVDLAALGRWLNDPWLVEQAHTVPFVGELAAQGADIDLNVRSTLVGLPVDLPPPLGKPLEAVRPFSIALQLTDQRQGIQGRYGDHLQFNLNRNGAGELYEGTVNLTQVPSAVRAPSAPPMIEPDVLQMNIDLPNIDAAAWWSHWRKLQALYLPTITEVHALSERADVFDNQMPIDVIQMRAGAVTWGDVTLNRLGLGAVRSGAGWQLGLHSRELAGNLMLPADSAELGELTLDHVRFDVGDALPRPAEITAVAAEATQRRTRPPYYYDAAEDGLATVEPWMIPAMQVVVNELTLNDIEYGRWQFDVLPENDQIRLEQIQGAWRGIHWLGDMIWRIPEEGEHSTQLDLSAETGNLANVLLASGLTPLITSRSAASRGLLEWRGSPLAFDVTGLRGSVDFDLRTGNIREMEEFDGVRVIGLLNVTRIFRRLALDFRDIFTAGIAYDRISGDLQFREGRVGVGDRFLVDGAGAKVFFGGSYDMFADELDAEGVVIARVSNTAGLIALGAGFSPPVALMVIFSERVLERELERLFSVRTRITGSLAQPDVRASRLFDSNIRGNDATIEERMRELFGPETNR